MLAAVIKITSKLSVALARLLDVQIIIIYRTGTVNINFTIYGQQIHTHTFILLQSQTDFRAQTRASVAHFAHWAFLFALLRFLRVLNNKKWSFGGEFIVLQFNFPWFPGLEFGDFYFRKNNCVHPLIYVIICWLIVCSNMVLFGGDFRVTLVKINAINLMAVVVDCNFAARLPVIFTSAARFAVFLSLY